MLRPTRVGVDTQGELRPSGRRGEGRLGDLAEAAKHRAGRPGRSAGPAGGAEDDDAHARRSPTELAGDREPYDPIADDDDIGGGRVVRGRHPRSLERRGRPASGALRRRTVISTRRLRWRDSSELLRSMRSFIAHVLDHALHHAHQERGLIPCGAAVARPGCGRGSSPRGGSVVRALDPRAAACERDGECYRRHPGHPP